MTSQDPQTDGNFENDGEFERHFNAFAEGKPTPEAEEGKPDQVKEPEGNDPEGPQDEAPADKAATDPTDPNESVTSGEPTGATAPAEAAPDPEAPEADFKALYEAERKAREQAEHRARSDAARVAALSRKLQAQSSPDASATKAPEPSEAQKALDAKIDKLRKEYGDIADPLVELNEAVRSELAQVKAVVETVADERQAAVIAAELRALDEKHPDWRQVAQSPEFEGWLQSQPDNIKRLAQSWDAKETSVVLSVFKAEAGHGQSQSQEATPEPKPAEQKAAAATDAKRSLQLEGGREVRSKGVPASSGPPEDFDAAFAHFAAQREAKRLKQAGR